MRATQLQRVHLLVRDDVLQLGNDPMFYRVVGLERSCALADVRCKVSLRSLDGAGTAMLVRAGRELVLSVPRHALARARQSVQLVP